MTLENTAWVMKYAPTKIEDILLSDNNRSYFTELKDIPNNLLFLGSAGAGKTTLAKFIARKFAPSSYMFLNASDESGIDVVRTKIKDFIGTMSLDGNQKIIILDEVDGFSLSAQDALRFIMEEYIDDVKFILTGNFKNKIREAIQSRCVSFDFAVDIKPVFMRIMEIMNSENIILTSEQKKQVVVIVKRYFPDIRKTINEIQKCCITGEFIFNQKEEETVSTEVFDMISSKTPVWDIRSFVISNESSFGNDYHFLMRNLFNLYINNKNQSAVLYIVDRMYRHAVVADPEVNFTGLLIDLTK